MTIEELRLHLAAFGGSVRLKQWPKRVLWGVAPTGPVHFGYAPYLGLLRLFAFHGAKVILLIANYHGFLDSNKTPFAEVATKTKVYKTSFVKMGVPEQWLIETNEFYFTPNYFRGLMEFTSHLSISDALAAAGLTLRSTSAERTFGDMLYVATQIYDVQHLGVDCVICGQDEAGIYEFGLPALYNITDAEVDYAYLPIAPGLESNAMHASDASSNKLLLEANPSQIAFAFSRSSNFTEHHSKFTFPLLNHQSSGLSEPSPEAIFKLLRGQT